MKARDKTLLLPAPLITFTGLAVYLTLANVMTKSLSTLLIFGVGISALLLITGVLLAE